MEKRRENKEEVKLIKALENLRAEINISRKLLKIPFPIIKVEIKRDLKTFINLLERNRDYNLKGEKAITL